MNTTATWMPRSRAARGVTNVTTRTITIAMTMAMTIAMTLGARPANAAGEWWPSLVVLPASGRGVSSPIVERARALLVESLGRPHRFRVTDLDRPPTSNQPGAQEAINIALMTRSRVAVALDISHDGGQTIFDVRCWDVYTNQSACHLHEATGGGPELLPDLTEWLALRLIREVGTVPDPMARDEAIAVAAAASRPRAPRMVTFGARADLMVPIESPARSIAPLAGFTALTAIDAGYLLANFGVAHESGSDSRRLWGVGFDLLMPLSSGERLTFVGAGAWLVAQHLGGRGASGMQLRPTAGMLWGRHDIARVRIDIAYFVDLFEEREPDRLIPGSGQAHLSHGLMFSVGATF